jgi:hypothetical protein
MAVVLGSDITMAEGLRALCTDIAKKLQNDRVFYLRSVLDAPSNVLHTSGH